MSFKSHPVVKAHEEELEKILVLKSHTQDELYKTLDELLKTKNPQRKKSLSLRSKELEQRLFYVTKKADLFTRKLDELNGDGSAKKWI